MTDADSAQTWARLLAFLAGDGGDEGDGATAYEALRERLAVFFGHKGHSDALARTDETFDRVARLVAGGADVATDVPARFVLGVARNIHREAVKREIRARTALERPEPPPPDPDEEREAHARHAALSACLETLLDAERSLILRYHAGRGQARIEARRAIANDLGVTVNSLRIRAHRIRGRLERCTHGRLAG